MDSAMPINIDSYLEQSLEYVLPAYLLQYLLNLETLAVESIKIRSLSVPTLNQTRLKSLIIDLVVGTENVQTTHVFFNVVLSACPFLEYFNFCIIGRSVDGHACLVLDMRATVAAWRHLIWNLPSTMQHFSCYWTMIRSN